MSNIDKTSGKYTTSRPCSAKAKVTVHGSQKNSNKTKEDLSLTGSQIHLACRPKQGTGRISSRSPSAFSFHKKRPMSSLSELGYQRTGAADGGCKRSQSADIPYRPGADHSVSSSECDLQNVTVLGKPSDGTQRKNKLAAKFPLFGENNNDCDIVDNAERSRAVYSHITGLDEGFGATYTLPKSHLLESLTSKPLGRAWTEEELRECCKELGIENSYITGFELESLESDYSNDLCTSEKSLGEQIIAMAQEVKTADIHSRLPLEPGLEGKPPLPHSHKMITGTLEKTKHSSNFYLSDKTYDPLFEKLIYGDKEKLLCQSACSMDKYNELKCDINNYQFFSPRNVESKALIRKHILLEENIFDPEENDMQFMGKSSSLVEKNDNNNQLRSNLEMEYFKPGNVQDSSQISNNVGDIKFPDLSLDPDVIIWSSRLTIAENETDMLLEILARDQQIFDRTNIYDSFNTASLNSEGNYSSGFGKGRGQELHLENLIEEDTNENETKYRPSTARSSRSNKSHTGTSTSVCEIQSVEAADQSDNSQKKNTDTEGLGEQSTATLEKISDSTKIEEKSIHETRSVQAESERISEINVNDSLPSTSKELVTSWLNTQIVTPGDPVHVEEVLLESDKPLQTDESTCPHGVERDSFQEPKTDAATPLEVRNISLPVPPIPADTRSPNLTAAEIAGNSTYDDIVTILKVLEEEQNYSISELKSNDVKVIPALHNHSDSNQLDSTQEELVTDGKLRDILTYLDEIEQCCDATLESAKSQLQKVQDSTLNTEIKMAAMPKLEELMKMTTSDLAHEILKLRLQLEEKNNSINLLQETLQQQRELTVCNMRNADRDVKSKLRKQKEEYEATVSRHQKFINQLIADKKDLSDKCESLVLKLKKSEEHHVSTMKTVEERHKIELQKTREMHAAAEKLRRERWVDNKTQKIKEMTVKGLEPELQRMNTRHQQELADLRMLHKQELDELDLRAARKTAQQVEQLRDQLNAEKEETLLKEKEILRNRIEKLAEQQELEYQAKRKKFFAEIQQEKERLTQEEVRLKQEVEEAKQNLFKENCRIIERLKQEHNEEMESIKRKHQNELKILKEALEAEKEAWTSRYKREQTIHMSQREAEIREQYKKERDKEIELVIERLENEATQSRAEMEQTMENRLRRLKDKYEAEIKDLEASELILKNKHNETKQKLVEKEDEVINLKANMRQFEKELEEAKKITDRLSQERADIKEIIRREFEKQLTFADQENIRLREELAELRTRHHLQLSNKDEEMAKVKIDKERQLQQVYDRVKLAVAKKDEAIQKLKLQYKEALERHRHLEELLEQQRRDYLLK